MAVPKTVQKSRDRLVANMIVVLPVIALALVIRYYQSPAGQSGDELTP